MKNKRIIALALAAGIAVSMWMRKLFSRGKVWYTNSIYEDLWRMIE